MAWGIAHRLLFLLDLLGGTVRYLVDIEQHSVHFNWRLDVCFGKVGSGAARDPLLRQLFELLCLLLECRGSIGILTLAPVFNIDLEIVLHRDFLGICV